MDKKGVTIYDPPQPCTCCNDVRLIMEFHGGDRYRDFAIYEADTYDLQFHFYGVVYYMLLDDDPLPLSLTEEAVNDIKKNPMEGKRLAYNRWFDRHR